MSTLSNAANFNLEILNNYLADVGVTVLFGLGFYLVKSLRAKSGDKIGNKKIKAKLTSALEKWINANTVEEYHAMIQDNYESCDPYEVMNQMVAKGLTPNVDTFNALLLNSYNTGNFNAAKQLRGEMFSAIGAIAPNSYTVNIVIKGINLETKKYNKKFDCCLEEFSKLLHERRLKMDIIAHNTIIDAYICQGRMEKAWEHYKIIIETGNLERDAYTYTSLLKGIRMTPGLSRHWLDKAFSLEKEIRPGDNLKGNFYNALLDACVRFDNLEKAETLFEKIIATHDKFDEYPYCIMIKAYTKRFSIVKALDMFERAKKLSKNKNSVPSEIVYGAILNAAVKCNQTRLSEKIFFEMQKNKVASNSFIYSTMIKASKKQGTLAKRSGFTKNL